MKTDFNQMNDNLNEKEYTECLENSKVRLISKTLSFLLVVEVS